MLQKRVALSLVLLAGSIVVPGYTAVNGGLSHGSQVSKEWSDGSPMPIPKPTAGELAADGSPMPIPKPTGGGLTLDGSPMPIPKPTAATNQPV
jgi:hypothetical protein